MKCTTVLHGGVWHRTSTPHKSGDKMKKKKLSFIVACNIFGWINQHLDQFTTNKQPSQNCSNVLLRMSGRFLFTRTIFDLFEARHDKHLSRKLEPVPLLL